MVSMESRDYQLFRWLLDNSEVTDLHAGQSRFSSTFETLLLLQKLLLFSFLCEFIKLVVNEVLSIIFELIMENSVNPIGTFIFDHSRADDH
jgi:hypothetical protein